MPAAPRTDPGVRNYRTGLLPRMMTHERAMRPRPSYPPRLTVQVFGSSLAATPYAAPPGVSLSKSASDRPISPGRRGGGTCPPRSPWPGPFPPPAPPAATRWPLFAGFAGTTSLSDFPARASPSCPVWVHGAGLALRRGRAWDLPASEREARGLPCEVLECVRGVSDHAGCGRASRWRPGRCCLPPVRTASAPRSNKVFEAQYPARTSLCQRFAFALTDADA